MRLDWEDIGSMSGAGDFNDYTAYLYARSCDRAFIEQDLVSGIITEWPGFNDASAGGGENGGSAVLVGDICDSNNCDVSTITEVGTKCEDTNSSTPKRPPNYFDATRLRFNASLLIDANDPDAVRESKGRTMHLTVVAQFGAQAGTGLIPGDDIIVCPRLDFNLDSSTIPGGVSSTLPDELQYVDYHVSTSNCDYNAIGSNDDCCDSPGAIDSSAGTPKCPPSNLDLPVPNRNVSLSFARDMALPPLTQCPNLSREGPGDAYPVGNTIPSNEAMCDFASTHIENYEVALSDLQAASGIPFETMSVQEIEELIEGVIFELITNPSDSAEPYYCPHGFNREIRNVDDRLGFQYKRGLIFIGTSGPDSPLQIGVRD